MDKMKLIYDYFFMVAAFITLLFILISLFPVVAKFLNGAFELEHKGVKTRSKIEWQKTIYRRVWAIILMLGFFAASLLREEGTNKYAKKEDWIGNWQIKMEYVKPINFSSEPSGLMQFLEDANGDLVARANLSGDILIDRFEPLGGYGNIKGMRRERGRSTYPYEIFLSGEDKNVFFGRYKDNTCNRENQWKMIIGFRVR